MSTANGLSGRARVAGVIGWPVAHSLSPRLHGYWLRHYGIDGAYVPLAVRPEDAAAAFAALARLGFVGANVTLPHKETALAAVARASDTARRIGAVNTLVVADDGQLEGDNTDAFGFLEHLRASRPDWRPDGGSATVLGAGGAARAVVAALLTAGVADIRIANRSPERARLLAVAFGARVRAIPWPPCGPALADTALLVNCTTLGMRGQPPLVLDLAALPNAAVVCDIVYTPLQTPLLAEAARLGLAVVDGLGMLLHQARPGFARWFGINPEVTDDLRAHVLAGLAEA